MKLHFEDKALRLIAKKAMAKNTGARGLRALLESILTEAMYEVCKNLLLRWMKETSNVEMFSLFILSKARKCFQIHNLF